MAAAEGDPRRAICRAITRSGKPCRYKAKTSTGMCGVHSSATDEEDGPDCPICLVPMPTTKKIPKISTTSCGHTFHTTCLRSWFRRRPMTCPMCRACCLDSLGLMPGTRLLPKLQALVRTCPPPPGSFFPSYIVSHLQTPCIASALGSPDIVDMVVDVACECFTQHNFFARLRSLGV